MAFSRVFAMLISSLLLIEGVWGQFSSVTFGILSTNRLHSTIHILMAALGLLLIGMGRSRIFLIIYALIVVPVGIAFFLPVVGGVVTELFALNTAVAIANIILGCLALVFAFALRGSSSGAVRSYHSLNDQSRFHDH